MFEVERLLEMLSILTKARVAKYKVDLKYFFFIRSGSNEEMCERI